MSEPFRHAGDPVGPDGARGSRRRSGPLMRLAAVVALALATVCAVVGAITQPVATTFIFALLAVVVAGPVLAVLVHDAGADTATSLRCGALAAGCTIALFLSVSGIIAIFGHASTALLPLLIAAAALWTWTRRRDLLARARAVGERTGAAPRHAVPGHHTEGRPPPDGTPAALPPSLVSLTDPRRGPDHVTTAHLCRAWRESYWLLLELPAGQIRDEVVHTRGLVLAELEHRDPPGFARWLDSVPRPGADPSPYLRTGG